MGNQALQMPYKWTMTKEILFPKHVLRIYQYLCKKKIRNGEKIGKSKIHMVSGYE